MLSGSAFAQVQNEFSIPSTAQLSNTDDAGFSNPHDAQKTTGLTDTLYFANSGQTGGPYSAAFYDLTTPVDSGRFFGMNKFGYKGFAQLYRFSSIDRTMPVDTTYNVLGVYALFAGTVSSTSTKTATITLWKRDAVKYPITGRSKFYVYGVPQSSTVATKSFSFPKLTLNAIGRYFFTTPITGINYDLYAGYTLSSYSYTSLGGDTIGLATSENTNGGTYTLESGTGDTLVSTNTLIQNSAGKWMSSGFELNRSGDLVLFPIIKLSCASCTSSTGISYTQNNLTMFGSYPNPAVNGTNIRFALKHNADVTIYVTDIQGKQVKTIKNDGLSIGEHVINIVTSDMAAGNYTYLILTSNGDGVASEFTVVK